MYFRQNNNTLFTGDYNYSSYLKNDADYLYQSLHLNDNNRIYTQNLTITPASFVNKDSLNCGNKIILPLSALQQLLYLKQNGPMIFKIKSMKNVNKVTYAGVLKFTAEEGNCVIPDWMFDNMQFFSGFQAEISFVNNLPKGKLITLEPLETAFAELPEPRAIIENHLRNFICLTEGETITLKFHNTDYQIDIVKVTPESEHKAVCINEADVEIDLIMPIVIQMFIVDGASLIQQSWYKQERRRKKIETSIFLHSRMFHLL